MEGLFFWIKIVLLMVPLLIFAGLFVSLLVYNIRDPKHHKPHLH